MVNDHKFAFTLMEARKKLHLSRKELAAAVGCSVSYIAALETAKQDKSPSLEKLSEFIDVLSSPTHDTAVKANQRKSLSWSSRNREIVLDLLCSAVDLERKSCLPIVPWTLPEEMQYQKNLQPNTKIFILTDVIAEGLYENVARKTVNNIVDGSISYCFFVPFSTPSHVWQSAYENVRGWTPLRHQSLLPRGFRIYGISDIAGTGRIRITLPLNGNPEGCYNVSTAKINGIFAQDQHFFVPMPQENLLHMITTLEELVSLNETGTEVSSSKYEMIKKISPVERKI